MKQAHNIQQMATQLLRISILVYKPVHNAIYKEIILEQIFFKSSYKTQSREKLYEYSVQALKEVIWDKKSK